MDGSGNHKRFLWGKSLRQQEPQTGPDTVNATTQLIKCPLGTVLRAGDIARTELTHPCPKGPRSTARGVRNLCTVAVPMLRASPV